MAQSILGGQAVGFLSGVTTPTTGQVSLDAAAERLLYTFVPLDGLTLNKVRFYVSAVTGTLGSSDISVALVDFAAGLVSTTTTPNSAIETSTTVTSTPTGAAWVEATGFTTALTAGKLYGIVISNANGTPASNNFQVRWVEAVPASVAGSAAFGWRKAFSSDSGSTYGTAATQIGGLVLEFSTGATIGSPLSNVAATGLGDGIYSARELGAKFTTPADAKLRVKALATRMSVTGTPTGTLRFRLYAGTTHVADSLPVANWQSTHTLWGVFSTVQVLDPSTVYRIMLAKVSGDADASGNRVNLYEWTVENVAASKATLPFGGWVKTHFDGTSTWTDTDTAAPSFQIMLDSEDHFDSSGSGDYPDEGDVRAGVDYNSAALTGTFVVPAEADVEDGVFYGADGTEFEGTLEVGGGDPGGAHIFGGTVVR